MKNVIKCVKSVKLLNVNLLKKLLRGYLYFPAPGSLLGPRPWSWPPTPALVPNLRLPAPGAQICICRPWAKFVLAPNLYLPTRTKKKKNHFSALVYKFYLPTLALALAPRLVFTNLGQDFTTTTDTVPATTTTTSTIATTTNDYNNKKCIRGSKIRIKWSLKDTWWKIQVLFQ